MKPATTQTSNDPASASDVEPIPHNRPLVTAEDRAAVDTVLRSGWIAQGGEVDGLETDFATYYGGGGACALASGTAALFLALKVLDIGAGARVAVPSYACTALLNAVYMAGAEPLVVDVTEGDFNIDPAALEHGAAGRPPQATIAVHTFGAQAPVKDLAAIGGAVIEDCCQSLGGTRDGRPIGSDGRLAVFSFYATKIVTCGHGGLLYDPDGTLADTARDYRNFDQPAVYAPRFNLHMSDIEAAMARSQFDRIGAITSRRQDIARRYLAALPESIGAGVRPDENERMVYRFVLRFPDPGCRDRARKSLADKSIQTIIPIERFELLHRYLDLDTKDFPVSERIVDTTLSLPVFPGLTDSEVDRICAALTKLEA